MTADFLLERLRAAGTADAVVWRGRACSCEDLLARVGFWTEELRRRGVPNGAVVALEGDFSPNGVALFLALASRDAIIVPVAGGDPARAARLREIAQAEHAVVLDGSDDAEIRALGRTAEHPLIARARAGGRPGLVIFTSGSTGTSKAALHDLGPILDAVRAPRRVLRSIAFLLYDHIGGVNTMLYALANGACLVTVPARDPDTVLRAVQEFRVELLPASPTFLNMMLIGEAHRRHDLSSLSTVSYGTEPMPDALLARLREALPGVEFVQLYGLTEAGILRSTPRSPGSPWLKLGGPGLETRVVDGLLQVRAASAMLGYLNAPDPFTADGWLNTGDAVESDGEWLRVLGRRSEIINVGGEKVHPAEVEGVLQSAPNVLEAAVFGENNALTGQAVVARLRLAEPEEPAALRGRLRAFCRGRLRPWQVPARFEVSADPQHGARWKKRRPGAA